MSGVNRVFQECLFESLVNFKSDDFSRMVSEIDFYPDELINDLIFADFDFDLVRTLSVVYNGFLRRKNLLSSHMVKAVILNSLRKISSSV